MTGIGILVGQYHPLEGAGLAHSHDRKVKPGVLKIGPYLATHMNGPRAYVVVIVSVPHDLWLLKERPINEGIVSTNFRTDFQAAQISR